MFESTGFPYVERRLANGLRIVVSPDRVAPVVAMNLWYDVGSRHERPGRSGFAHLFEHLMFEGSTTVASGEHMRVVNDAGGSVNATTSTERTAYVQTVPVEQLELMLFLEADRMAGLLDAVTQECLDKQRDIVKNERRQRYDDQPYGTAHERLLELLFPVGHPYHHMPIGSMEDLDAAALEDVHEFFRTYYTPDNAVLALVGDVDPEEAFALAEKHFGGIPSGGGAPAAPDGLLAEPLTEDVRIELQEKVPAGATYMAWRLPAHDHPALVALEVATAVMTNGRAATLYQGLVEGELAQQVTTRVERGVAGASYFTAIAIARAGVDAAAIEAHVLGELTRLGTEGPTPTELERAKSMRERGCLAKLVSLEGRAEALARSAVIDGDPGRVNTEVAQIRGVTADDVRSAVSTFILGAHRGIVEYQPIGQEVAA